MKLQFFQRRESGMNVFEVLVMVAIVVLIAAIFLPALLKPKRNYYGIHCANNLKQVGLAYRIWAGDHNDLYPMEVSVTNGGARELAVAGNAVAVFQVMSNELSTPMVLFCYEDFKSLHQPTNSFEGMTSKNVSYFVGLDAGTNYSSNSLLSGDANLTLSGAPVKPGLLNLASNAPVGWTAKNFHRDGNIGLNDGSVQEVTSSQFTHRLVSSGLATNRLAIP